MSHYAWNSTPIDDTDIIRGVAAAGRKFRFPLDIELLDQPSLNDKKQLCFITYAIPLVTHILLYLFFKL